MKKHTIDASGKTIGRVASVAAKTLLGKTETGFARNKVADVTVEIINVGKAKITENRLATKLYSRYSGYPDGLRKDTMAHVISRKGRAEIFRKAVYGMIPSNKLRSHIMKRLTIKE